MWACQSGHDLCARALIEAGGAVDARQPDGETSLTLSCRGGHEVCTRVLLEAGAAVDLALEPDAEDGPCFTALMFAAQNGHDPCTRALIEAGADTKIKAPGFGNAYEIADGQGHTAICKLLNM